MSGTAVRLPHPTAPNGVIAALREAHSEMGQTVAIDGSDLPAYANGQKYVSLGGALRKRSSNPDASWGHQSSISTRNGGYYGYKVHAASAPRPRCRWRGKAETARDSEIPLVPVLVDMMHAREFAPGVLVLDRGYDTQALYEVTEGTASGPSSRCCRPPLSRPGSICPPSWEHRTWAFAGSDVKCGASKWRCPSGECKPGSVWLKADRLHNLIPRATERWKGLYHQRGSRGAGVRPAQK